MIREALERLGREDLIGNTREHLVPAHQPGLRAGYQSPRRKNGDTNKRSKSLKGKILTQHTGLPPRAKR